MFSRRSLKRTWSCCLQRCASTFVDPFGAKYVEQGPTRQNALRDRNAPTGYSKTVGNPEKGLADDTSVHPFGDLRVNFARLCTSNLCLWWEYDFTGGQILNNGQNALLSQQTKDRICAQHRHDPQKWSVENLAMAYGIRQQRIQAILTLADRFVKTLPAAKDRNTYKDVKPPEIQVEIPAAQEADDTAEEPPSDDTPEAEEAISSKLKTAKEVSDHDWLDLCDWAERQVFGATASEGSGERHFVSVPTYPKFEEIPLSDAQKYANTEWDISRINRLYTAKEDRFQIREFKEQLAMNTGTIGKSLDFKTDRTRMHRSPPKHDSPIVITSLDQDIKHPYVAEPDGTQRRLTPDEFLLWKRSNRATFTRLIGKQIEKEGKRGRIESSTEN